MTGNQLTDLMFHVAWLGVLLLVGKFLRVKIRLFQKLFMPSAVIAGVLGLLLGPYVLGRTGFQLLPQPMLDAWALYPGRLINVVFACLFLGFTIPSMRDIWREGGPQLCYGWVLGMGQYVVGVGLCVVLLTPVFGVPHFFGCLLEIGFSGGHGTAAGMRETFARLGFGAGADLGLMSATVGILAAVVFGMVLINLAARRGYTHIVRASDLADDALEDGLIPEPKRTPGSMDTISASSLAPFSFHLAFVGASILIGQFLLLGIRHLSAGMEPDLFESFPLFPLAMLGGLSIQIIAEKTGLAEYFDRKTFNQILGLSLDFLVVSAVAAVRLDVFFSYLVPFVLLIAAGLIWVLFVTWFLAPRMLPDAWFERSITEYGMQTGVTAMGLMLLRVVDPHFETPAAKSFGFKQILYEPMLGGGFITAAAPLLIVHYGAGLSLLVAGLTMVAALVIAYFSGWLRRF